MSQDTGGGAQSGAPRTSATPVRPALPELIHRRLIDVRWLPAALTIGAIAVLLRILYGNGYVAYDGMYSLVWGSDLAHGRLPDFEVAIAPTPHPLLIFIGVVLSPFGGSAPDLLQAIVVVSFAVLGWAAFELGRTLFSWPVGVLFAAILLTRNLLVTETLQASQDIPFMALVMSALLLEAKKRRHGLTVLALLAAAGLLRPEAWLLSIAYLIYLFRDSSSRERLKFTVVAFSAPVIWASLDLIVTGDPLFSLHGTQSLAAQLNRPRELDTAVREAPGYARLILHNPILWIGLAGSVLALYALRDRSLLPASVAALGLLSFFTIGLADLPVIVRYLLLPAAILALFCAVAIFGWLSLPRGDPQRAVWVVASPFFLVPLFLSVPTDQDRVDTARRWVAAQRHAQDSLRDLAEEPVTTAWMQRCRPPTYVPNHRVVPLLASWLDEGPSSFVSTPLSPSRGLVISPANPVIAATLVLDPHEPRPGPEPPEGFTLVHRTADWNLYARCHKTG